MNSSEEQNTATGGIPETLIINGAIMIALLIVFLILRPRMARFFYPKYRENKYVSKLSTTLYIMVY
jgi:hypothetical protein